MIKLTQKGMDLLLGFIEDEENDNEHEHLSMKDQREVLVYILNELKEFELE